MSVVLTSPAMADIEPTLVMADIETTSPVKPPRSADEIMAFCEKYGCEFVSGDDKTIIVLSKCGHYTETSNNKFFKYKLGVYCDTCMDLILKSTVVCFKCNTEFVPTRQSFLFCSKLCTQSRIMTDEKKDKIRTSVLKHIELKSPKRKIDEVTDTEKPEGTKQKNPRQLSFSDINDAYEERGCKILTTEEEFNSWRTNCIKLKQMQFDIISSCGHTMKSFYVGFIQSDTGIVCKDCRLHNASNMSSLKSKDSSGYTVSLATQQIGVNIIKTQIESKFTVKKTHDGCESTILVRPIDVDSDSWLQIKVKASTTNGRNGFRINKVCKNIVVAMVHIESSTVRVFLPEELKIRTYYIGLQNEGHVNNIVHNLEKKILELYNVGTYNESFVVANMPVSEQMRVEYNFMLKRERLLPFIKFEQSNKPATVYNFKVNSLKFQEIVVSRQPNKSSLSANISKHAGKTGTVPYFEGDNDFYWVNINDTDENFYVIPETILLENGYISCNEQVGKKYVSITEYNSWLQPYRFCYKTINTEQEKERFIRTICLLE